MGWARFILSGRTNRGNRTSRKLEESSHASVGGITTEIGNPFDAPIARKQMQAVAGAHPDAVDVRHSPSPVDLSDPARSGGAGRKPVLVSSPSRWLDPDQHAATHEGTGDRNNKTRAVEPHLNGARLEVAPADLIGQRRTTHCVWVRIQIA